LYVVLDVPSDGAAAGHVMNSIFVQIAQCKDEKLVVCGEECFGQRRIHDHMNAMIPDGLHVDNLLDRGSHI
jgi:hypothetical protein